MTGAALLVSARLRVGFHCVDTPRSADTLRSAIRAALATSAVPHPIARPKGRGPVR